MFIDVKTATSSQKPMWKHAGIPIITLISNKLKFTVAACSLSSLLLLDTCPRDIPMRCMVTLSLIIHKTEIKSISKVSHAVLSTLVENLSSRGVRSTGQWQSTNWLFLNPNTCSHIPNLQILACHDLCYCQYWYLLVGCSRYPSQTESYSATIQYYMLECTYS